MGCVFFCTLFEGKCILVLTVFRIACLRRFFSLVVIPPLPYPSRFARHLPHAGKAFVRGIVCMFPPSFGRRCPEGAEVGFRSGVKGNVREAVFSYFRLY